MTPVPLKGDAEIIPALLGNHVQIGSLSAVAARAQAEGGKLRILLSFDPAKEFGLDPTIPDFASVFGKDMPDIEVALYLSAPAKTPNEIIQVLENTMEKVSKRSGVSDRCKKDFESDAQLCSRQYRDGEKDTSEDSSRQGTYARGRFNQVDFRVCFVAVERKP